MGPQNGRVQLPGPVRSGGAGMTRIGMQYHGGGRWLLTGGCGGYHPGCCSVWGEGAAAREKIPGLPALALPALNPHPSAAPAPPPAAPAHRSSGAAPDLGASESPSSPIAGWVRRAVPDKTDKNHGQSVG